MLPADNWQIKKKIKLYNWRYIIVACKGAKNAKCIIEMNIIKGILLVLLLAGFTSSCSRKRAPSKGCDCPGGHGMLKEKNTAEPATALYPKSGSQPS
jgi:hypothetical protein